MKSFLVVLIFGWFCALTYKVLVINAKFPTDKMMDYLNKRNLNYIRHRKVKKPWNPNFESGESFSTLFSHLKHNIEIDAIDSDGNPIVIDGRWYQSMSFFDKNRLVFDSEENE